MRPSQRDNYNEISYVLAYALLSHKCIQSSATGLKMTTSDAAIRAHKALPREPDILRFYKHQTGIQANAIE